MSNTFFQGEKLFRGWRDLWLRAWLFPFSLTNLLFQSTDTFTAYVDISLSLAAFKMNRKTTHLGESLLNKWTLRDMLLFNTGPWQDLLMHNRRKPATKIYENGFSCTTAVVAYLFARRRNLLAGVNVTFAPLVSTSLLHRWCQRHVCTAGVNVTFPPLAKTKFKFTFSGTTRRRGGHRVRRRSVRHLERGSTRLFRSRAGADGGRRRRVPHRLREETREWAGHRRGRRRLRAEVKTKERVTEQCCRIYCDCRKRIACPVLCCVTFCVR